ncbi:MAG: hypothetical protein R6W90_08625, partial [Ignavibacteriaceae bacterium]
NFIGILTALKSIADESYKNEPNQTYESIPFNDKFLMDVIIRNLKYSKNGFDYLVDIGINREEVNLPAGRQSKKGAEVFYYDSIIEDLGDLSVFYGYEDYDFSGMEVNPGKTYPKEFNSLDEIKKLNFYNLYSEGYTNVILNSENYKEKSVELPINITRNKNSNGNKTIRVGGNPDFIIKKDGRVRYAIVNGFVYDLENPGNKKGNGIVLR